MQESGFTELSFKMAIWSQAVINILSAVIMLLVIDTESSFVNKLLHESVVSMDSIGFRPVEVLKGSDTVFAFLIRFVFWLFWVIHFFFSAKIIKMPRELQVLWAGGRKRSFLLQHIDIFIYYIIYSSFYLLRFYRLIQPVTALILTISEFHQKNPFLFFADKNIYFTCIE